MILGSRNLKVVKYTYGDKDSRIFYPRGDRSSAVLEVDWQDYFNLLVDRGVLSKYSVSFGRYMFSEGGYLSKSEFGIFTMVDGKLFLEEVGCNFYK